MSDDSKVFVSAKVGKELERGCVLVYNINGVLRNRIENASLGPVREMTSIDSEDGRIVVLASDLDSLPSLMFSISSVTRETFSLGITFLPTVLTSSVCSTRQKMLSSWTFLRKNFCYTTKMEWLRAKLSLSY